VVNTAPTPNPASLDTGAHVTPGHPNEMDCYRSELGGILALVILTKAIDSFHDIQAGTIELGCKCETSIIPVAIFKHIYDAPKQAHFDLI
jgi:hypothetical protein